MNDPTPYDPWFLRILPRSPWLIAAIGCLVVASTLGMGLAMDDVLMRMRFLNAQTAWGQAPWWDVYTFAREHLNGDLRAAGFHPWWSDPTVKMTFFRPLSAASHALDYALWPDRPWLQHLHSVLWYGLAVALATMLYRHIHRERATFAAMAGLAFAIAAPHVSTVAWIAARNTIISFVFACVMLHLHVRGRVTEARWSRAGAVGVLALGLLSGEAILGGLGYVVAWQLCLDDRPWHRRLAALIPYGVTVGVWRLLYVMGGFGSHGSGIYHDPGSDMMGFFGALATNLPVLLMSRWTLLPVDGWAIMPSAGHRAMLILACVVVPALGALLWSQLRTDPRVRFWALGMVLSLVPFTATMPMDRLLLFSGLGAAALLASLAHALPSSRGARVACFVMFFWHLPVSVIWGATRGATMEAGVAMFNNGLNQAPKDAAVPSQTFVYIAGTFHRVHFTTLMRLTSGEPAVPRRSVVLSSMLTASTVTRMDDRTLEIEPEGGFMAFDLDRIHRRDATSFSAGDVVALPDLDVIILELTPDGRPARAMFRFHVPLEDPSLRWLVVAPERQYMLMPAPRTRAFALPAIGESVRVEALSPAL